VKYNRISTPAKPLSSDMLKCGGFCFYILTSRAFRCRLLLKDEIMNQSILDILPDTEYVKFNMYRAITQKFPQINTQTKVKRTSFHAVHVAVSNESCWYDMPRKWQDKLGFKARLWRSLGELLNRPDIKAKGKEYGVDPIVKPAHIYKVELERLSMIDGLDSYSVYLGYSPLEDILYYIDF
jgi:hypothetical protein